MSPRALFLTTSYPRHPDDWAGRFVAEFAADLVARGWRVRVLAPGRGWSPPGVERLRWPAPPGLFDGHGAPEALRRRPLIAPPRAAAAQLALTAAARRCVHPADVIVGHWLLPAGPAALAAARRHGNRTHLVAHGSDVALLERLPRAVARLLDRVAGITFVSRDLSARFAARLGRPPTARCHVHPMGIPPPSPCRATLDRLRRLAAGRPIVASVGRLVPLKGFDVLAEALGHLPRPRPLWVAAGDGPERARLADRCAALGVDLHLPGPVGPAARDALLAAAAACVVPSRPIGRRREGTPLVVLEALSAGAPLIASAIGGIPAVADPAGALLVPPADPRALAGALSRVLGDPALSARMRAAHRRAGAACRWSVIGAAHEAALRG